MTKIMVIDPHSSGPMVRGKVDRCEYCLGWCGSEDMKFVQLTHMSSDPNSWQHPKWVSKKCREYLNGFYRYVKSGKMFWCASCRQEEVCEL